MNRQRTVVILGGSLSGNKGAASMALAVADGVRKRVPGAQCILFSPYALDDRGRSGDLGVVPFGPMEMIRSIPAAVLCWLTGRRWRPKRGPMAVLADADVAVDVSGIAFMDGRGLATLGYNVLLVLLPWLAGTPVVKMAQALGPFESWLNRMAASIILRLPVWIGLRGAGTEASVRSLGLSNAEPAADVAFLLEPPEADEVAASRYLPTERSVTLIAPSAVVDRASRRAGIDYIGTLVSVIHALRAAGHRVQIVAHSARTDAPAGKTNDLPLCREIGQLAGVPVLDREIDAYEMRELIRRARMLVTSRFHAMVSGLATATPTFVIGWSHKYREVLTEFGLEEWVVDFRELSAEDLAQAVLDLDANAGAYRKAVERALPDVVASAEKNLERLLAVLNTP